MTKARSVNQFTYKPRKSGKYTPPKHNVIPGQAVSVRELLEKHSRGMPLPPSKEGQYFEDTDVPDFDTMDLSDVHNYITDLKDKTEKLKKQIQEEEKENEKMRLQKQLQEDENRLLNLVQQGKIQLPDNQQTTDKSTISP